NAICLAILLSEIPTATLLYLYLHQLAQRMEERRAAAAPPRRGWPVAVLMAASLVYAALIFYVFDGRLTNPGRIAALAMGASATLVALVALSCVAPLTLTAMSRTGVTWLQGTPQGLLRRVGLLIRAMIPS